MTNTSVDVFLPEPSELARILKYDAAFATHLVGCTVVHKEYGECVIEDVEFRDGLDSLLAVREKDSKDVSFYKLDSFDKGFFTKAILKHASYSYFIDALSLANRAFKEEENQLQKKNEIYQIAERNKAKMLFDINAHKKFLNIKTDATYCGNDLQASFFLDVLKRIVDNEEMTDKEIAWCKSMSAYEIVAKYNAMIYQKNGKLFYAAMAASNYRKAKLPEDCIEFSNNVLKAATKIDGSYGALITSCGAAYRDIGSLPKAARYAEKAISLDETSYYPWNLLGAVYYEQGNFEEGDACFDKAIKLGSSLEDAASGIRGALIRTTKDTQAALARHLIVRDPVKYFWAEKYT